MVLKSQLVIDNMHQTPDLSQSFNPVPKVFKLRKSVKSIKKVGKKTKAWEATKKELKPEYEKKGITFCEIGKYVNKYLFKYRSLIANNRHNFFLNYAHGDKRNNLKQGELKDLQVLSCIDCHTFIEKLPHEEMRKIVEDIIKKREI